MAFFRPHVYSAPYTQHQPEAEPSFHGLFRLLEDWDNHHNNTSSTPAAKDSSNNNSNNSEAVHPRKRQHLLSRLQQSEHKEELVFTPRFDVKETESTYELHGDLPGVAKDAVNIEFTDPQTLVVSGRVERSSLSPENNNRRLTGPEDEDAVMVTHHENEHGHDDRSETSSQRSFQATVEDDTEDSPARTAAKDNVSKTVATTTAKPKTTPQPQAQQPNSKYWISERPHGNFSRTFAFPERLDLDGVTASLENGVLALVVPKARKYEAKRISVL